MEPTLWVVLKKSFAAECENTVGGYNCFCLTGFKPSSSKSLIWDTRFKVEPKEDCVNINECELANP